MPDNVLSYDNLIASDQKGIVNRDGTVALGQTWVRGTVVGLLTATGKWQIADFTAIATYDDVGIASEAVDTNEGEIRSTIFVEGEFNKDEIEYSYGDTITDWLETFADQGIYLRTTVGTDGIGS